MQEFTCNSDEASAFASMKMSLKLASCASHFAFSAMNTFDHSSINLLQAVLYSRQARPPALTRIQRVGLTVRCRLSTEDVTSDYVERLANNGTYC